MAGSLRGRSLVSLQEWSRDEIGLLLEVARQAKAERRAGVVRRRFEGKSLALIFEKRSTRTRSAFETAFGEEGGWVSFLSTDDIHLGVKESVEDTARVLGRMYDGIEFRGYAQETVESLARWAGVPVYNGLTDSDHPTQVLADLLTLQEAFGRLEGLSLAFVGDGRNNMAHALLTGLPKMGVSLTVVCPPELAPRPEWLESARAAALPGAEVRVVHEPGEGVRGADAVYTDVWASMGEEDQAEERRRILAPYQVNGALMAATGRARSIFLHCLPANKGQEVSAELFESEVSRVFDQAENRKHTIKALMLVTLL
ncbi:MAG: ornithine carbamoyltransferase [Clostridia bacterium]|nr:ornithine carbamoyltransferase [Clostridia bacterium]